MIADSIKALRENCNLTQVQLAEKLGVTRSSVNAWEMGSSLPTIPYVLKMANIFGVSTDLVLDRNTKISIETDGLDEYDVRAIHSLIVYLRKKNGNLDD